MTKKTRKGKNGAKKTPQKKRSVQKPADDLERIEFHRNGMALMPELDDAEPGVAFLVRTSEPEVFQQYCTCKTVDTETCPHIQHLKKAAKRNPEIADPNTSSECLKSTVWQDFASIMAAGTRETPKTVGFRFADPSADCVVSVYDEKEMEMLVYYSRGKDCVRFLERCVDFSCDNIETHRGKALEMLTMMTLTPDEKTLLEKGMKSRRQALEENFWYRFAYHCYREFGADGCAFYPETDETSGTIDLSCRCLEGIPVFKMTASDEKADRLSTVLEKYAAGQIGLKSADPPS